MWIDKDAIAVLIDAVEIKIKEEMKINEGDTDNQSEDFDPNDVIIYQSFVLPLLEEKKDIGFDSDNMLHKGFSFLISLIPQYLKKNRGMIDRDLYGKVAKIYYNYSLNEALSYMNSIEDKYISENLENINRYIDRAKIIKK